MVFYCLQLFFELFLFFAGLCDDFRFCSAYEILIIQLAFDTSQALFDLGLLLFETQVFGVLINHVMYEYLYLFDYRSGGGFWLLHILGGFETVESGEVADQVRVVV